METQSPLFCIGGRWFATSKWERLVIHWVEFPPGNGSDYRVHTVPLDQLIWFPLTMLAVKVVETHKAESDVAELNDP